MVKNKPHTPEYIVVKGCAVDGKRLTVGEGLPENMAKEKVARLVAMGRVADVKTDEGAETAELALKAHEEEQERLAGERKKTATKPPAAPSPGK